VSNKSGGGKRKKRKTARMGVWEGSLLRFGEGREIGYDMTDAC
jgi:hypothetical protein